MKYEPSLPEHNDNVSHDHPAREFLIILAGMTALGAIAFVVLGLLIDLSVDHLSDETEAKINSAMVFTWQQEKSVSPQQAMLQTMADALKQCAELQQPITIHLTTNNLANAAALPGGHIVVFSGLLDKVKSQNGLSFVLAHELGHLKNRDHLRGMGRSIVLIALSSLLTGTHSDLTTLFIPVNQAGAAKYSQGRETQADSSALKILNCRYGHVGGATEFFEAMKKDGNKSEFGWTHYFSSHPELQARIDSLNRSIEKMKFNIGPVHFAR